MEKTAGSAKNPGFSCSSTGWIEVCPETMVRGAGGRQSRGVLVLGRGWAGVGLGLGEDVGI